MEESVGHSSLPPTPPRETLDMDLGADFSANNFTNDDTSTPSPPAGAVAVGKEPTKSAHPKRKPEKSAICRIHPNEFYATASCTNCNDDFLDDEAQEDQSSRSSRSPSYEQDSTTGITDQYHTLMAGHNDHQEDAVNNNQTKFNIKFLAKQFDERGENDNTNVFPENPVFPVLPSLFNLSSKLSLNEQLVNSNMTLEAINNTRITLTKLAAAAVNDDSGDEPIRDLSVLQTALYNLQQQQVIQMQLIKRLQEQLSIKNKSCVEDLNLSTDQTVSGQVALPSTINKGNFEQPNAGKLISNLMDRLATPTHGANNNIKPESSITPDSKDRPLTPTVSKCDLTSAVIQPDDAPPTSGPNTLEMLQRTANQVLSNASQGLLTNRLIDDYSKDSDGNDASNKHRCRYCGKIFGSDSALQIHLRSHTGERPFKCNICGNRFTTKGNLKVHFQRHQSRFPHIKMNPHPIPEHLDKLYPPLLAQLGELSDCPPGTIGSPGSFPAVGGAPFLAPHSGQMKTPPPLDNPLNLHKTLLHSLPLVKDKPEHLHWQRESSSSPFLEESLKPATPIEDDSYKENESVINNKRDDEDKVKVEPEFQNNNAEDSKHSSDASPSSVTEPKMYQNDETSDHNPRELNQNDRTKLIIKKEDTNTEQNNCEPSNICQPLEFLSRFDARPKDFPNFPLPGMRFPFPLNFPFLPGFHHPMFPNNLPSPQPRPINIPPGVDPAKDPNVYNSLLPRPGSTDNSWEALIEISKTNETTKLEELVKKIEYKLEPNQCIICHRVLSCKSALQMHYRTHTGERPFKCKICNHTFTTKGNLKTHMSVHRARPHVGVLHQCPVCHKKFGNALVLQQHIRLHTGESTDLSPEQIAAAEVRDVSTNFQSFPSNMFHPSLPMPPHHLLRGFPSFPLSIRYPVQPYFQKAQESKEVYKQEENELYPKFGKDLQHPFDREQKVAEDLSTRPRDASRGSSPRRSVSPSPSDYSDPGMREGHSENSSAYHSDHSINGSVSPVVSMSSQENQFPPNLSARPPQPPFWPFGLFPQPNAVTPMAAMPPVFSPLYMHNIPGRGNTTCKICFKTLACQSALEIHYRSHTKERPFKCLHCDRGFTTRGNMKQHLLTHKIRDSSDAKSSDEHSSDSSQLSRPAPDTVPLTSASPSLSISSPCSVSCYPLAPPRPGNTYLPPSLTSIPAMPAPLFSALMPRLAPGEGTQEMESRPSSGQSNDRKIDTVGDAVNLKREGDEELQLPQPKRLIGPDASQPLVSIGPDSSLPLNLTSS